MYEARVCLSTAERVRKDQGVIRRTPERVLPACDVYERQLEQVSVCYTWEGGGERKLSHPVKQWELQTAQEKETQKQRCGA